MKNLKVLFFVLPLVCCVVFAETPKSGDVSSDVIVNSIGVKLARIPAGSFLMGSAPDEKGRQEDEFQHEVAVNRPFFIGVTEVTQTQWLAVMPSNNSNFQGGELPVEKISWTAAVEFCKKLSEKEGKKYRLPTEAEWEYACREGSTSAFAGTGDINDMGWYRANSDEKTHPVASKKPNAWGLYDMHGNVSEWCGDLYSPDYTVGDANDPNGQSKYRVVRGGSWNYTVRGCRSAARSSALPSYQLKQTGLRVVMEVSE